MDFYGRVKQLYKKRGYASLKEFILAMGVNYETYYSRKELGNIPRADEAVRIAQALGVSVEYLVTGKEAPLGEALNKIQSVIDSYKQNTKEIIPFSHETRDSITHHNWGVKEIPLLEPTAAHVPTRPWADYLFEYDPSRYFCTIVQDNSMYEAFIPKGDHALFLKTDKPEDGRIMLISYKGSNTIKRIKVVGKDIFMLWEDGSGKQVKLTKEKIHGVLTAVFHPTSESS